MGKLVRDKIQKHIEARGEDAFVEHIDKQEAGGREYYLHLVAKLNEEVEEFRRSSTIEELADIAEVLRALSWQIGYSPGALEKVRVGKEVSRGGFLAGVYLLDPEDREQTSCCCKSLEMSMDMDAQPCGGCHCCQQHVTPTHCLNG